MSKEKIILARLKKSGSTFEVSIDPDKAVEYKNGNITDLREVLMSDEVFSDAKKGQVSSKDELEKAFQTTDKQEIARRIITEGEIQLSSEHRSAEREQKHKQLVNMIHKVVIDPTTGFPHPITRIEAALEQGKISLSEHKSIEEQFDDVISKLRPIIPIKIEQKVMTLTIQSSDVGKLNQYVRNNSKVLKEQWNLDGSWTVKIEIPAGFEPDMIDRLNSLTHGKILIDIENDK